MPNILCHRNLPSSKGIHSRQRRPCAPTKNPFWSGSSGHSSSSTDDQSCHHHQPHQPQHYYHHHHHDNDSHHGQKYSGCITTTTKMPFLPFVVTAFPHSVRSRERSPSSTSTSTTTASSYVTAMTCLSSSVHEPRSSVSSTVSSSVSSSSTATSSPSSSIPSSPSSLLWGSQVPMSENDCPFWGQYVDCDLST
jgi:hypothetical protein